MVGGQARDQSGVAMTGELPPAATDEIGTLLAFLDQHRDTLRLKTADLDARQLAFALSPTSCARR